MTIAYDMNNNYSKLYDEANGIYLLKKELLLNTNVKLKSYKKTVFKSFLTVELLSLSFLIIGLFINNFFIDFVAIILIVLGLLYLLFCNILFNNSVDANFNSKKGTLIIDKKGILDKSSNGNSIFFAYENIELIVITNNLIIFLSNSPIMLFIPTINKEEFISNIKKYSHIAIIDKSII